MRVRGYTKHVHGKRVRVKGYTRKHPRKHSRKRKRRRRRYY